MNERDPIAALAGHFDWVEPSGFTPTLGLIRGALSEGERRAATYPAMQRTRPRARKYPLLEPGQRFGAFTVVRQLDRDSTCNERVLVRCDAGHTRTPYAHNVREWPATKRCKSCDVVAQRDSTNAGISIGGGPAFGARAR